MLQCCSTFSFFNGRSVLLNCDALGNHEELEEVKRLLKDKPGANKVYLGKGVWSQSNQWQSWDAIFKTPI